MGWLSMPLSSMHPHTTPKAYLDAQFTYMREQDDGARQGLRILASSCLRNKVYYAAAVPSTNGVDGPAFAVVCMVRWNQRAKGDLVFAYRNMTEDMGPNEAECPERILSLLGETDSPSALVWRKRCIDRLMRPVRKIEDGMRIKLAAPVKFTDGYEGDEFTVCKRGRKILLAKPGGTYPCYRLPGLRTLAWTVIPETRVHKTLFG